MAEGPNEAVPKEVMQNRVVQFLLQEKYVLTAFELLHELLEDGQLTAASELQDFFSDGDMFPPDQMLQLQSLEAVDLQKLADEKEAAAERAAVSQYELRIAKEDIKALQEKLERQEAIAAEAAIPMELGPGGLESPGPARLGHRRSDSMAAGDAMGDSERRNLNCAVKEYLVQAGYKLTAMTFCDEVDGQDLDDWLPGPAHVPEALRSYYHHFLTTSSEELEEVREGKERAVAAAALASAEAASARAQAEEQSKAAKKLRDIAESTQKEVQSLRQKLAGLKKDLEKEKARAKEYEEKAAASAKVASSSFSGAAENGGVDAGKNSEAESSGVKDFKGQKANGTMEEAGAQSRRASTASHLSEVDGKYLQDQAVDLEAIKIVAESLPKITPNVLINKREELLPLIMVAIERHPESNVRDSLTNGLFNLIKKPDDTQRKMIMDACVSLAQKVGELRTEEELLPQCWEQISHRLPERRLLVAASCGQLAPFVRAEIRTSLILSILQQLADDNASLVREAVVENLAALLPLFPDHERYAKVEEVSLKLLLDPAGEVVERSLAVLLPALVEWAKQGNCLMTKLLPALLARCLSTAQRCTPASGVADSAEGHLRVLSERERWNLDVLVRILREHLLLEVRAQVVLQCPFPCSKALARLPTMARRDSSEEEAAAIEGDVEPEQVFLDVRIREYAGSSTVWGSFDWVVGDFLPTVLQLIMMLQSREELLRIQIVKLLLTVGASFGRHFLELVMAPMFLTAAGNEADLSSFKPDLATKVQGMRPSTAVAERLARMTVLPLLMAGVLGAPSMRESALADYLRELALQSSLKNGPWSYGQTPELIDAVRFLCTFEEQQGTVLAVLWELVVNPSAWVKVTTAVLLKAMVPYVNVEKVSKQVLPALVTLGSDPNVEVKHASIEAFGAVATHFKDDTLVDKIRVQMDSFLDDGSHEATVKVVKTLTAAAPVCSAKLRDYLLQKLLVLASANNQSTASAAKRHDMAEALYEAACALNSCELAPASIRESFVPALQALLRDPEVVEGVQREGIESMLRERAGTIASAAKSVLGAMHLRKASMESVFDNFLGSRSATSPLPSPLPSDATSTDAGASSASSAPLPAVVEKAPVEENRLKRMMRQKYEDMMRHRNKTSEQNAEDKA